MKIVEEIVKRAYLDDGCVLSSDETQPLVRCSDCEYSFVEGFVHERLICEKHQELGYLKEDWFCADGWKA